VLYPRKLICIGTNYHDHVIEMGVTELPAWPYSFLKPPTTTVVGSGATVAIPAGTHQPDWEVELGIVIGSRAKHVKGDAAMAAIAGYTVVNDVSVRDWLAKRPAVGIDWMLHKAFDGFAPLGPWFTPASHVPQPQNLDLSLSVNGVVMQSSSTSQMVFDIRSIVEHLASIMTLEPGDIIATGTPAGVGFGKKPQVFLRPGDLVEASIEGLGTLQTRMVAET
jgi:2-keto-4-pentenoate hydratase/2-oxohepta-3-ene-1,7-dioic acid hydratase in catechol pathway